MAINKNHEFEDLNGVKCAVVERNASQERCAFLKTLLDFNHYTVVIVPGPPPKVTPPAAGNDSLVMPLLPSTFTVGVTDVMFNATNAIFGRLLRTSDNHVVTLAYWQQKEEQANDEIPYFEDLR